MHVREPLQLALAVASLLAALSCARNPDTLKHEHLARGDRYVEQKKYAEAIVEYRGAVQADSRFGDARKKLGDAYLKVGDDQNAFREYVRAADLLPNDLAVQLTAGNMLRLAGRFEDAKTKALEILKDHPNNLDAALLLGATLLGLNDPDAAIAQVEEAIEIDPKESRGYVTLGAFQLSKGRAEEAEAAFRKAVDLDPLSAKARSALAVFLWAQGRVSEAEASFKQALELDATDVIAARALIAVYLTTNRAPQAEPLLKKLATTGPVAQLTLAEYYLRVDRRKDASAVLQPLASDAQVGTEATLRLASIQFADGHRVEGNKVVDDILQSRPNDASALYEKAQFLLADNRVDDALVRLKTAAAADPKNALVRYLLGTVYTANNNAKDAIDAFTEVLKINPRAVPAQIGIARLSLATGNFASAATAVAEALKLQPDNLDLHLLHIRALLGMRSTTNAEPELRALLARYPKLAAVHTQLGVLYGTKQDERASRRELQLALELDPTDFEALSDLVTLEAQTRHLDAARRLVDAHVARAPDNPAVLILAARTYATSGDVPTAEALLKKAIEKDSANLSAYGLLGQLFVRNGQLEAARTEFDQALARDPKSIGAHTMIGIILEAQNKPEEATRRYERVMAIDPNAAVAANNLAYLYVERGENLDVALQLAQKAKQKLPSEPQVNDTLGWIYYKKNLPALALPHLEQTDANNPLHLYHLGVAYKQEANLDKARQALERALKLKPNFPGADEAKKLLAIMGR